MNHKHTIWKLYFFRFLISLFFFSAVLVPFFTDYVGISLRQVLLLEASFAFFVFILEIPTGAMADRIGRKKSLMLASVGMSIGVLIYANTKTFEIFLIAEFVWALGVSLYSGAFQALIYDTLAETGEAKTSKKIFARSGIAERLGYLFSAFIGSIIAAKYGLRIPMVATAFPIILSFFIAFSIKEPKMSERTIHLSMIQIIKTGITTFKESKILQFLALDAMVLESLAFVMIWVWQPLFQDLGVDIIYFGSILTMFVIGEILFMNNYERLEKLLGSKKKLVFFSSLISGIMFVIAGIASNLWVVFVAVILSITFGMARMPLMESYMNKHVESSNRATVISIVSMIGHLLTAIVLVSVGYLVEWSITYTLIIVGIIIILFSIFSAVEESHLID